MSHLNFAFSNNFRPIQKTCLVTLFDHKIQVSKLAKMDHFRIDFVNENVARFARSVECDFFGDFQTLWATLMI